MKIEAIFIDIEAWSLEKKTSIESLWLYNI